MENEVGMGDHCGHHHVGFAVDRAQTGIEMSLDEQPFHLCMSISGAGNDGLKGGEQQQIAGL